MSIKNEGYESNETYVSPDYFNVITQIETYYYRFIELYTLYTSFRLKGKKDDFNQLSELQGLIIALYTFFKEYRKIRVLENKKIKFRFKTKTKRYMVEDTTFGSVYEMIERFEAKNQNMDFNAITLCKNMIVKCHHELGLSDIEKSKIDLHKRYISTYGHGQAEE